MVAVVWVCSTCDLPISLACQATRIGPGDWTVHIDGAIRIHLKQHEAGG